MANLRKVVEAPRGYEVVVVPEEAADSLKVNAVPQEELPNGSPVIAVEDPPKYCIYTFTEVDEKTGIKGNYLTAVMRELGIRDDPKMSYEFAYGKYTKWKYS